MIQARTKAHYRRVRQPSVAGVFYPDDPALLRHEIAGFLREASSLGPIPKALIVPHAGYRYSGPVAASAYALLKPVRQQITRVVLLGPSHRVPCYGLATVDMDAFATPLGLVPVERKAVQRALGWPQVQVVNAAHVHEHSLEVQLPLLQMSLDEFSLVPLAVGVATADEVAEVLDSLWGGVETLIVVSSDLSHYHDYATAQALDRDTADLIKRFQWKQLRGERACGYCAIGGLLRVAEQRRLHVRTVDLRNSGDTSGVKDQVVGYGGFVLSER